MIFQIFLIFCPIVIWSILLHFCKNVLSFFSDQGLGFEGWAKFLNLGFYNWRQLIVVILLTKKLNSLRKLANDGWLYQTNKRRDKNWKWGSFWSPSWRIHLFKIQIWSGRNQRPIQTFLLQLFHILGQWLWWRFLRWQKRKRTLQEIHCRRKNESCWKGNVFFYLSWFQVKILSKSQEKLESPGETCSDGKRTAAKERKEVADQLMLKCKKASTKKSWARSFRQKKKSENMP